MAAASATWTPEAELALFQSMVGLRPIGIHKHFRMLNIYTRLQHRLGKTDISLNDMKSHIAALFDLRVLDEIDDDYEDDDDAAKGSQPGAASSTRQRSAEPGGDQSSSGSGGEDSDGGSSSDGESSEAGGAHGSDAGSAGPRTRFGHAAPASAISAAPDTSDPNFWRRDGAEFSLPWAEYGAMMVEKAGVGVTEDGDEDANPSAESSSAASTPNAASPAIGHRAEAELEAERESSDGRISPVARQRRGRSSTPVPRNRTKAARNPPSSARKRQLPR
ncbi:hypothetical protein IWQ57_003508 [Coemansia nantahalensis]|uniref:Uncharacterized protein n=1 Tax=Coemansia nantahalensis TaxID=2789366 RepID=A0ACC1JVV2_9FUNG|nr:hypothetical protein IWQ57_003508 [Coemansia nantahalensis]